MHRSDDTFIALAVVGTLVLAIGFFAYVLESKPECRPGEVAIWSRTPFSYGWFCGRAAP